jgi:hypothetical protein
MNNSFGLYPTINREVLKAMYQNRLAADGQRRANESRPDRRSMQSQDRKIMFSML